MIRNSAEKPTMISPQMNSQQQHHPTDVGGDVDIDLKLSASAHDHGLTIVDDDDVADLLHQRHPPSLSKIVPTVPYAIDSFRRVLVIVVDRMSRPIFS